MMNGYDVGRVLSTVFFSRACRCAANSSSTSAGVIMGMRCHSPHQVSAPEVGKLERPASTRTGGWAQQKPLRLVFFFQNRQLEQDSVIGIL